MHELHFNSYMLKYSRVRESIHRTSLLPRAGKQLVPYLKDLVGVWLCAQYDTHRDVAALARLSFERFLPAEKRKKLLQVPAMRTELLAFISAALLNTTAESMKDASGAVEDPFDLVWSLNTMALRKYIFNFFFHYFL